MYKYTHVECTKVIHVMYSKKTQNVYKKCTVHTQNVYNKSTQSVPNSVQPLKKVYNLCTISVHVQKMYNLVYN